jgi:hypothetical protein
MRVAPLGIVRHDALGVGTEIKSHLLRPLVRFRPARGAASILCRVHRRSRRTGRSGRSRRTGRPPHTLAASFRNQAHCDTSHVAHPGVHGVRDGSEGRFCGILLRSLLRIHA